ncbi:MAG TPA: large conductance mechanosensitive channel protein MscL [Candidatus Saccharimonadales bacterium]|nr:large conductance mechanosensitive channel protein MscL [Candidatus Saccharimonadales bacterium]
MAQERVKLIFDQLGKPIKQAHPLLKEFRDFAMRGNVIDLAVGVIIGAAFTKIVDSLVTNVIMPPLSLLTGGIDLSHRVLILSAKHYARVEDAKAAKVPVLSYGAFLDAVLSFLLVSFTIFLWVRTINKLHRKPDAPPEAPKKDCPFCFSIIPAAATRCPQCTSTL